MFKAIVFVSFVALATCAPAGTEQAKVEADQDFLVKQKAVLQLLLHIHQPIIFPELREIAASYDLEANVNNYNDAQSVAYFLNLYKSGAMLNSRDVFSPLYKAHMQQAKAVYGVLYNAKDWDTFYKTAIWMRENVNAGVFVYSFTVVVRQRPDTKGVIIPALYEINPHLFVREEIVEKAYEVRMQATTKPEGKDSVIIPTNYTGWYRTSNPELRTSYYNEDVGLNTYHYDFHVNYPSWIETENLADKNTRRGELFWYVHQQIIARYELERLSNNMNNMVNFTFEEPNIVSYNPGLRYPNGQAVPVRPQKIKVVDCDATEIERIKDFENRVREAIDTGYVTSIKGERIPLTIENGMETMGRLLEKTADSVNPKYYGALYQLYLNLVGHITDPYHNNNVAPSSLEHFHTTLRDPMYYPLIKRMGKLVFAYKKTLPVYTKEILGFPGVAIESVEVDKLMTYFENFDLDITNVVNVGKIEDDKVLKIVARQPRLNHKEFTYRINVNSDKDVVGMVRVYLAPKYEATGREMPLNERKYYMIQIDRFPYQIAAGKTVIERNSRDSSVTVSDMTSFRVLYKQVEDAIQGKAPFYINERGQQVGFPSRLILPKGTKSGKAYTLYVVITPFAGEVQSTEPITGFRTFVTCGGDNKCTDTYPLGFPYDREIVESEFQVPNIYETDVLIYHKNIEDTGKDI